MSFKRNLSKLKSLTISVGLTLAAGALITGSLVPSSDSAYDIGSGSSRWATGYFDTVSVSSIQSDFMGDNVVTVGKSGNVEFNTIQGALDSITDASSTNQYTVRVGPGVYEENVVGKDYVSIKGMGDFRDVVIKATSGTAYTGPANASYLFSLSVVIEPTESGAKALSFPNGGSHTIDGLEIGVLSSSNGITATMLDADGATLGLYRSNGYYTMTGNSAGSNTHDLFKFTGSAAMAAADLQLEIAVQDVDDDYRIFVDDSTGLVNTSRLFIYAVQSNASYSGTVTAFAVTDKDTVKQFLHALVILIGSGSGTGIGLSIDTDGNSGSVSSEFSSYTVLGFGSNVMFSADATDTISSNNDYQNAETSSVGTGSVDFVSTQVYGSMYITGGSSFSIDTTDEWHAMSNFTEGTSSANSSVIGGLTGSVTAFADAGGGQVTVTSAGHGLSNGDVITLAGTTNYNGTFEVANVTTDTFEITDTWVADDGTGTWHRGTSVQVEQSGDYKLSWAVSAAAAGANKTFDFVAFAEGVEVTGTKIRRKFSVAGDYGSVAGEAIISLNKDDVMYFAISNVTDATDITIIEGALSLVKVS